MFLSFWPRINSKKKISIMREGHFENFSFPSTTSLRKPVTTEDKIKGRYSLNILKKKKEPFWIPQSNSPSRSEWREEKSTIKNQPPSIPKLFLDYVVWTIWIKPLKHKSRRSLSYPSLVLVVLFISWNKIWPISARPFLMKSYV
jgi:hypothetical protein